MAKIYRLEVDATSADHNELLGSTLTVENSHDALDVIAPILKENLKILPDGIVELKLKLILINDTESVIPTTVIPSNLIPYIK